MAKTDLTAQRLRELLDYNPETGVFTWRINRKGHAKAGAIAGRNRLDFYRVIGVDGKAYLAHRLAWLHVFGEFPMFDIDHLDGDPSNNALINLRDEKTSINMQNIKKAKKTNKCGILGVGKNKKRWSARIYVDGKTKSLGTFDSPEEAGAAYIDAKRRLHVGCTI